MASHQQIPTDAPPSYDSIASSPSGSSRPSHLVQVEISAPHLASQVFRPRPAGQYMELECHTVRVQVEEIVRLEQKIYFLDIEITARSVAPTASEMIEDAIDAFDVFHKPSVERKAAKGALLGKMKRFRLT
nr:hypothetical protein B0A51_04563 [Rachicladosporium sp. CCFEE 5018]